MIFTNARAREQDAAEKSYKSRLKVIHTEAGRVVSPSPKSKQIDQKNKEIILNSIYRNVCI